MKLEKIIKAQRQFVKARRWEKFHSPKNIVMALAGEVGELIELFQWLTEKQSRELRVDKGLKTKVEHEIADIFFYLCRLSDLLEIDLERAFWTKLEISSRKYPVKLAKGSARKYTDLALALERGRERKERKLSP